MAAADPRRPRRQPGARAATRPGSIDYDLHYRDRRRLCGSPSPEFRRFFAEYPKTGAAVLDLGCGQGRDALLAARHGHEVLGIDRSAVGIAQMLADAAAEGLRVRGRVGDVITFRSRRRFDVVLIDRVLHLLPDDAARRATLNGLSALTRPGGLVLIADVAAHRAFIRGFFARRAPLWRVVGRHADVLCVLRRPGPAEEAGATVVSRAAGGRCARERSGERRPHPRCPR